MRHTMRVLAFLAAVIVSGSVARGQSSLQQQWDRGLALFNQGDYAAAEPYFRAILARGAAADPNLYFSASNRLGILLNRVGRYEDSVAAYEAGIAAARGMGHSIAEANLLSNMGAPLNALYRWEESEQANRRALELYLVNGGAADDVAGTYVGLSSALSGQRKHDECLRELTEAIEYSRLHGVSPSTLAQLHSNTAFVKVELRDFDGAEAAYRETLAALSRDPSAWRDRVLACNNLAYMKKLQDDLAAASRWNAEAIDVYRRSATKSDALYALLLHERADLLFRQRSADADGAFKQALDARAATVGTDHADYGVTALSYGEYLRVNKRLSEAEQWNRKAVEVLSAALTPESEYVVGARTNLSAVFADQGKLDAAIEEGRACIEVLRNANGMDSSLGLGVALNLAKWERLKGIPITTLEDWIPVVKKVVAVSEPAAREVFAKWGDEIDAQLKHAGRDAEREAFRELREKYASAAPGTVSAPRATTKAVADATPAPPHPDPQLSRRAAAILGSLRGDDPGRLVVASASVGELKGADRAAIVPPLIDLLEHGTTLQRSAATAALNGVASDAMQHWPRLIAVIEKSAETGDAMVTPGILGVFAEAGSAAKPALPELRRLEKRGGLCAQMMPFVISRIESSDE